MRLLNFAAGMSNLFAGILTNSNLFYIAAIFFFIASLFSPEEL